MVYYCYYYYYYTFGNKLCVRSHDINVLFRTFFSQVNNFFFTVGSPQTAFKKQNNVNPGEQKLQVPFGMVIINTKHMYKC